MVAQLNLARLTLGDAAKVEQRSRPRKRVFMPAKVAVGGAAVDCTVTDISASGIKLHAASVLRLPDEVWLLILSEGLLIRAQRIWSRFPVCGLKLTSAEEIQRSTQPQAEPLKEAWETWCVEQARSDGSRV